MLINPITEEIREIRHRLAAQFGNDIDRIVAETQRREAESGRKYKTPTSPPMTVKSPFVSVDQEGVIDDRSSGAPLQ
jgi:hypothetical protein